MRAHRETELCTLLVSKVSRHAVPVVIVWPLIAAMPHAPFMARCSYRRAPLASPCADAAHCFVSTGSLRRVPIDRILKVGFCQSFRLAACGLSASLCRALHCSAAPAVAPGFSASAVEGRARTVGPRDAPGNYARAGDAFGPGSGRICHASGHARS